MISNNNLVVKLLRSYHDANQSDLEAISPSDSEIDRLYKRGLSSVAIASFDLAALSDHAHDVLRSADLTAQVIYQQIFATTLEILDIARQHDIPVVLLKGVVMAADQYRQPHHRIMGDIDVLVPEHQAKLLYDSLREMGYYDPTEGLGARIPKGHHHLPELKHPDSNVPVEVHTALFSRTVLANEKLLQTHAVWEYIEPAEFYGKPCLKFCPEFQLLYAVAHWAIDYKWPTNIISINDVVLMLQNKDSPIDWMLLEARLTENPLLADILSVLLLFLSDAGVVTIPSAIAHQTEKSTRRIGKTNMKILHWLLYQFPIRGRRKVAWAITRLNARLIWLTLLEPRHKWLRIIVAATRISFRRTRGKSLLGSTAGRIRTLLEPND